MSVFRNLLIAKANKGKGGDGTEGFVDLGLPSGLLWATCNLGANAPHESGLYFQWGATEGHAADEGYNFSTSIPPVIYVDLTEEHDAAAVMLGNGCHMPSVKDAEELAANCYMERVTNYNNTGVSGVIFYSCKDNATGKGLYNSAGNWYRKGNNYYNLSTSKPSNFVEYKFDTPHIFIPSCGWSYVDTIANKDEGLYWLKTYISYSRAYCLFFNASMFRPNNFQNTYSGMPIRPVRSTKPA